MKNQSILIVDDEPIIVEFISKILTKNGLIALTATNGELAIEIALAEKPDLVIMDWEMPILDGIETLKALKGNKEVKSIPVILVTGRMTSSENLKNAFTSGAIDFIRKPIEPIELLARTKSHLELSEYHKSSLLQKNMELALLKKNIYQDTLVFDKILNAFETNCKDCALRANSNYNTMRTTLNELTVNRKNQSWKQFEEQFKSVHPHFSDMLLKTHPNISNEELRLCYYLRLNMNTKEIASISHKNNHSIDIARYRLRKKFNLSRLDTLHAYLSNF